MVNDVRAEDLPKFSRVLAIAAVIYTQLIQQLLAALSAYS